MTRFEKRALGEAEKSAYSLELSVRFQDVDAAQIVFFARFFDYVHAAYEGFLEAAGSALPQVLREGKWAAPLRHAEADYLSPARFGDKLLIELVAARAEESELSLGWRVKAPNGGKRPYAVVQTVHTFVHPKTFERIPLPPEIFQKLQSVLLSGN